jgi:uncharacterized membrane protein (DUF485 family)
MAEQGKQIAMVLIVCFMVLAVAGQAMIAFGKADMNMLETFYKSLGNLAVMFGFPTIITAYIVTRGQTADQPAIIAEPLKPA